MNFQNNFEISGKIVRLDRNEGNGALVTLSVTHRPSPNDDLETVYVTTSWNSETVKKLDTFKLYDRVKVTGYLKNRRISRQDEKNIYTITFEGQDIEHWVRNSDNMVDNINLSGKVLSVFSNKKGAFLKIGIPSEAGAYPFTPSITVFGNIKKFCENQLSEGDYIEIKAHTSATEIVRKSLDNSPIIENDKALVQRATALRCDMIRKIHVDEESDDNILENLNI